MAGHDATCFDTRASVATATPPYLSFNGFFFRETMERKTAAAVGRSTSSCTARSGAWLSACDSRRIDDEVHIVFVECIVEETDICIFGG